MKLADLEIKTFVNSDFGENLYVVRLRDRAECVIVDPGMEPERAIDYVKANGLSPRAVLITHGHYDHIGGLNRVKAEWPEAEVLIGEHERWKMNNPEGNLSVHFGAQLRTIDADRSLTDGETFTAAGIPFTALRSPGHASGHVVYKVEGEDGVLVFVGDVIFAGSIGRTDFPDGDTEELLNSIKKNLLTLPDDTLLLTGHGPATKVGREKGGNPWL
ncbi:MAG: MBL fold metallo-hydrolase [Thermoguttaceae bacterium]|nr:MBL fold metallo-hydrolase [Thermoguttaceae bacterium]